MINGYKRTPVVLSDQFHVVRVVLGRGNYFHLFQYGFQFLFSLVSVSGIACGAVKTGTRVENGFHCLKTGLRGRGGGEALSGSGGRCETMHRRQIRNPTTLRRSRRATSYQQATLSLAVNLQRVLRTYSEYITT